MITHRTIRSVGHIIKLRLRMNLRKLNKIKSEITEQQRGFVEGESTNNTIFILRIIEEGSLDVLVLY